MDPTSRGRLIGLHGAIGSGKSTVANRLVHRHGFKRHRFAGVLKDMLRTMLRAAGYEDYQIERIVDGDRKEASIPEFGMVTSRHLQQTLGTEWGREIVDPYVWVRLTIPAVEADLAEGNDVVVDDLRLPNEWETLRDCGAHLTKVVGREAESSGASHYAENALNGFPFHAVLHNDEQAIDLAYKADTLVENLPDPHQLVLF